MTNRHPPLQNERETLFGDMFDLFRLIQRRNRFVGTAYGLPLGLSDAHALVEIDSHGALSAAQLGQLLCLKKASMFYLVDRLKKRRLIQVKAAEHDRRATSISLTVTGGKLLQKLDSLANTQLEVLSSSLTADDNGALVRYLEKFSELHGVPPLRRRGCESALRTSIRRGTRALGLTTNKIFGEEGINALQWHTLSELSTTLGTLTALQLCSLLSVRPNTLSAALAGLVKKKFITQTAVASDRRKKELRLTEEGGVALAALKARGCARLAGTMGDFTLEELREFVRLLRILAGKREEPPRALLQSAVYVEQLSDKSQLPRLRGLYVEDLVRRNEHWKLAGTILSDESVVFVAYEQGEPIAVAELVLREGRTEMVSCAVFDQGSAALKIETFIQTVCRTFLEIHPYQEIVVPSFMAKLRSDESLESRRTKHGVVVRIRPG